MRTPRNSGLGIFIVFDTELLIYARQSISHQVRCLVKLCGREPLRKVGELFVRLNARLHFYILGTAFKCSDMAP